MIPTVPFETIKGEPLNGEQKSYLEGLFAGLSNRSVSFAEAAPMANPAASASQVIKADEIFEERVKRELHPLDAYSLLLEHASADKAPERENIFRFKWHGLFFLTPKKEAFMLRLRIPGGQLKTFQMRELSGIASELTSGYVQVTTRANIQMRLIKPSHAPEVLRRIQNVGLHSRGAGADNIRNITASATAGIDPDEIIDPSPFCHELSQFIIHNREFYNLPRKFNIAFEGGGRVNTVEDTNDIGFRAVRLLKDFGPATAGIYFRVALGGATGHKKFASDLGVLVRPDQAVKVAVALLRVYIDHGNRGDRKKARLKHLLETWSLEKYLEETEKRLNFKILRAENIPTEGFEKPPAQQETRIGIWPQKQTGLFCASFLTRVGEITPKQMLRIAEIADLYGSGDIRLTVWQNILIPNIKEGYVETVRKTLAKAGLPTEASPIRAGMVACTGNSFCKFAASNTKAHAAELADYLEKKVHLDVPLNIHVTGCPNSCAQHYMGDIGLVGAPVKVAGETMEGYHVLVGGGFGQNQNLGRQVFQNISVATLKPTLEKMLKGYLRHRFARETFLDFTRRHDLNSLQAIFSNDE